MKNLAKSAVIQWETKEICGGVRLTYINKENIEVKVLLECDVGEATINETVQGLYFRMFSLFKPEPDVLDDIESKESIFNFPD